MTLVKCLLLFNKSMALTAYMNVHSYKVKYHVCVGRATFAHQFSAEGNKLQQVCCSLKARISKGGVKSSREEMWIKPHTKIIPLKYVIVLSSDKHISERDVIKSEHIERQRGCEQRGGGNAQPLRLTHPSRGRSPYLVE